MIDYEDLILQRQEEQEIFEDDPDVYDMLLNGSYWWNNDDEVDICLYT